MADRVDAFGRAIDGGAVAHVTIDEPAGQAAAARGACEDDAASGPARTSARTIARPT